MKVTSITGGPYTSLRFAHTDEGFKIIYDPSNMGRPSAIDVLDMPSHRPVSYNRTSIETSEFLWGLVNEYLEKQ